MYLIVSDALRTCQRLGGTLPKPRNLDELATLALHMNRSAGENCFRPGLGFFLPYRRVTFDRGVDDLWVEMENGERSSYFIAKT